jgi:alkylation response protein AidB-like acyl-CoA dehydrogenase
MKLDLTPEQAFFAGTTRQFLDDKVPTSLLRELRDDPDGFGRDYWRQGADLGWTSLLVPEADGGGSVSGHPLVDLALVAHGSCGTPRPGR